MKALFARCCSCINKRGLGRAYHGNMNGSSEGFSSRKTVSISTNISKISHDSTSEAHVQDATPGDNISLSAIEQD